MRERVGAEQSNLIFGEVVITQLRKDGWWWRLDGRNSPRRRFGPYSSRPRALDAARSFIETGFAIPKRPGEGHADRR